MKRLLIFFIKIYQFIISPFLRPCCRFYPNCSEYAKQAIQEYGTIKGSYLIIKRLLKCHPLHTGGFDPLPVHKTDNDK